MTDFLTCVYH